MAIAGVQQWCVDLKDNACGHIKVVVAAMLVAGAVYLIWGQVAVMCYASVALLAYVYFGPDVRILDRLDLKGIALAAAVVAAPFFGGIPAYFAGAMAGISIITYEWQNYGVVIRLEDANQEFQGQNDELAQQITALQECERNLNEILEQAVGSNDKLRGIWEQFGQGVQKVEQAREGHAALLETMQKFHLFYQKVTKDKGIAADIKATAEMQRHFEERQLELARLEARIKLLTGKMETLHRRNQASTELFTGHVDAFGAHTERVRVVVDKFTEDT